MATVNPGRYTAEVGEDGIVVFLIGLRVNRLRALRRWVPVAMAMPKMLRELMTQPELGSSTPGRSCRAATSRSCSTGARRST